MRSLVALLAGCLMLGACSSAGSTPTESADLPDRPSIVVSTNILGDVVQNLVGDAASVVTIMPVGSDPHDFQPSAQQIALLNEADAVIINGGGFEQGLVDVVEAAEADGTVVFEAMGAVETLEFGRHEHDDDEHDDDEHDDDEHDDDEHDEGRDPHFFTDPVRMATAANAITEFVIADVAGIDAVAVRSTADAYLADLVALDNEIVETLNAIAPADRVLVTNHEVLTYFADQYDLEIIGTVIPGGTTVDSSNAEALAELATIIEAEGIPAVFSDTSSSDELAQTLALEVGAIRVVQLYSESLGPAGSDGSTYLDMMRTNAERIAEALTR